MTFDCPILSYRDNTEKDAHLPLNPSLPLCADIICDVPFYNQKREYLKLKRELPEDVIDALLKLVQVEAPTDHHTTLL